MNKIKNADTNFFYNTILETLSLSVKIAKDLMAMRLEFITNIGKEDYIGVTSKKMIQTKQKKKLFLLQLQYCHIILENKSNEIKNPTIKRR